ncbi:hypothetical protein DDB_G0294150 [Dictyostelium discoideum AX4]|uniref:Putative uncharacterized protein DDB_G0294150 n=1 Tax=Dictyostelium discoideum TaxID=44689 RepID=Y5069_DICDI|nr:hypothetical protein DDB_G0294150 [Dictyostelium discoideum AX4]Q54AX0.1 RecName: Full=Putative uncharacterized protein DDB_G0294150 [Dictyostelium discoideum]EAL60403.1 hypothetical protein DDB_G0294150 [Dictyostelium discoideum AX4]|eukprot:XP_628816.1 hypothetical protein DDB_G0294150 [Dictyostelium discoideum AX4]
MTPHDEEVDSSD